MANLFLMTIINLMLEFFVLSFHLIAEKVYLSNLSLSILNESIPLNPMQK